MDASSDSLWFSTRSGLLGGGEPGWEEVAPYRVPLLRLLARRYAWLPVEEREDLAHDLLLEIKQSLAARHDRSRGRFRALLQTVVQRRVVDRLRARRSQPVAGEADLAAPASEEVEALDLEAGLLAAVEACRDRFTQGPERDDEVLYALAERLLHGRTNREIAARGGLSFDQVARRVEKGREAIFAALLARETGLAADDPRLSAAVGAFKQALRAPGRREEIAGRLGDPALRATLDGFLGRFQAALPRFRGDGSAAGEELRRGLALLLEGGA